MLVQRVQHWGFLVAKVPDLSKFQVFQVQLLYCLILVILLCYNHLYIRIHWTRSKNALRQRFHPAQLSSILNITRHQNHGQMAQHRHQKLLWSLINVELICHPPDHIDSKGMAVEGTMRFLLVLILPLRDLPRDKFSSRKLYRIGSCRVNWTLSIWWSQNDEVVLIHWHQNTKTWENSKRRII